jgi:hypothetical protein
MPEVVGDVIGFVGESCSDGSDDGDACDVDPVLGQCLRE